MAWARVSLASRTMADIEKAATTLRDQCGVDARGYTFDARDAEAIQRWRDDLERDGNRCYWHGPVDRRPFHLRDGKEGCERWR